MVDSGARDVVCANARYSYLTSGWSERGGLTKNPYALDRNPCGDRRRFLPAVSLE